VGTHPPLFLKAPLQASAGLSCFTVSLPPPPPCGAPLSSTTWLLPYSPPNHQLVTACFKGHFPGTPGLEGFACLLERYCSPGSPPTQPPFSVWFADFSSSAHPVTAVVLQVLGIAPLSPPHPWHQLPAAHPGSFSFWITWKSHRGQCGICLSAFSCTHHSLA
jgi:hypothetical protein